MDMLVFEVAETRFGVPTEFVREVQRAVSLSAVPAAGPQLLGAMNLRGERILVLDIRIAIGAPTVPLIPTDHFLVIQCGQRVLAIRVDRALELVHVVESQLMESTGQKQTAEFVVRVARVADEFVHVIDPARLGALAELAP